MNIMLFKEVITLGKYYIDICSNLKYFLRIEDLSGIKYKVKNKQIIKYIIKIKYLIYCKFAIIKKFKNKSNNIYVIYYNKSNKQKIERKLEWILQWLPNKNVLLSNELICILKESKNNQIDNVINITNKDKSVYKEKIFEIVEYVLNRMKKNVQENNIYLLLKKYEISYKYILIKLAQNYKSLNIITYNVHSFNTLEREVNIKYDIPIIISNNKRKGLTKADYIINIDYDNTNINEYNLKRNSIIFNLSANKLQDLKGFNGIIINDITLKNKVKISSTECFYSRFKDYNNRYERNINIIALNGNNGNITI